jgi:hypothetical protein
MIHPAIKEELDMLKELFPGKVELTLDEYAVYFGLNRRYAPQHFRRMAQFGGEIGHKKIGKKITIPLLDFAYWLAQRKVVDGKPLTLDVNIDMKQRRGFAQQRKYNYRKLG